MMGFETMSGTKFFIDMETMTISGTHIKGVKKFNRIIRMVEGLPALIEFTNCRIRTTSPILRFF